MMHRVASIRHEVNPSNIKVEVEAYTAEAHSCAFVALAHLDSLTFSPGEAKQLALALLNAASLAEGLKVAA